MFPKDRGSVVQSGDEKLPAVAGLQNKEGRDQFRRILKALLRPDSYPVHNVEPHNALHTECKLGNFTLQQKIEWT